MTCSRASGVTTCETPSHHARRSAGWSEAGEPPPTPSVPDDRPCRSHRVWRPPAHQKETRADHHGRPRASHRGNASDTPEQLYGRGGRVRADRPPQPSYSTSSKPPPNNLQSLLRLFLSTTLLHPPLYEKKGRSRGRRGVAERKGRSRRSGEGVKFPGPGLADRGLDRTRAGPRPGVGALARVGLTGRNPAGITTTLRGAPGVGLRNASPAQRNPPHLASCELSATESACVRSARARLAQCDLR